MHREREILTTLLSLVGANTLLPAYLWFPLKLVVQILIHGNEKSSVASLEDLLPPSLSCSDSVLGVFFTFHFFP